jgi:glycosyltransferase involved in cell wall biosynthesis
MHHESGSGPEARIRGIYQLPAHRIAFSHFVKTSIESRFGCRIDDVVTNGVDTRVFFPDGERQERQLAMLYHPDPRKGAGDGLRALALVQKAEPRVTVRLCGTVHPADDIPAGMTFEFHPADADVRRLLSTSTALLYPSRYEGFGLPPLEAMACGCPVVTTDVGAIPEFVTDGVNGLVVPVGDVGMMAASLLRLLRDQRLQAAFRTRGLETADALSLDRVGPMFVQAIERLGVGR